jgi:hypothetical protein
MITAVRTKTKRFVEFGTRVATPHQITGSVVGCCRHGNEPLVSIKCDEFEYLRGGCL